MLRATGRVLRVESKPWTMEGRSGITHNVRLMVGDADFVDLKYPELLPLPTKGEAVDLAVLASCPGGRLSLTVRGPWAELVAAPVADQGRKVA